MFATMVEIICAVLVLIGIAKEEKLIELEDRALDLIANAIAKVIVKYRRKKAAR